MQFFQELLRRVTMLFRSRQFDDDLREEMQLHLELREQDQREQGLPQQDAQSAARRRFGNGTALREQSRESWGWGWLEQFLQDLRYASRNMLRDPGFTFVAVSILALGIGANTAIFSVVNSVLLQPLAYRDPGRLVTLLHNGNSPVAAANYLDWKERSQSFETLAAAEVWVPNLTGTANPEKVWALKLTANLLPALGVAPMIGRVFAEGNEQNQEVVLGYGIWQRLFAGDRAVAGKSIHLNGANYTVIGVMPESFQFAPFWATRTELFVPMPLAERRNARGGNSLRVFGRLKDGASLEQARAEIAAITATLEGQFPGTNRNVKVTPLIENVIGKVETPLLFLMGAVAFLLLVVCANIAHMLLARAAGRQKEVALRSALGASGTRLIRQFLAEGLLLAGCGAVLGIALAAGAIRVLIAMGPATIPRLKSVTLHPSVLLFSLAIALVTGIAFSFAPAFHAKTLELTAVLKESAKAAGGSVRLRRTRSLLAISEVALAFMLLTGAGLLVRSFTQLRRIDPGFDPSNVLSLVVSVAGSPQGEPGGPRETFYRKIVEDAAHLPGVVSAGAINHLPLYGDLWGWNFEIAGRPAPRPGEAPTAVYRMVTPGYFATMRLPILRGRAIDAQDIANAPGAVVISEKTAQVYWPNEDPIGKQITFGSRDNPVPWLTVVGIAKDARQYEWAAETMPEVYLAALQNKEFLTNTRGPYLTLVVRTVGDPAAIAPAVRNLIWSSNPNLPVSDVLPMENVIALATAQPRFEVTLLTLFAAIALLIAAAGIHALMSFSVSRRIHEIGVRMSLGASGSAVAMAVLREGMGHVLAGSVAGGLGALLLSRWMGSMLVGIQASDPWTFVAVAAVLNASALVAIYLPARRASRIDPIVALRQD